VTSQPAPPASVGRGAEPDLGPEVEEAVLAVLRSGQLAQGPVVERFEQLCAQMAGTTHAVAVSNGTASLEVALEALRIGPGDEVVTSPLTFAATINAVLRSGATVRFADIGADYNVDPDALAAAVTPRTAALLPVHLYGLPADMTAVAAIAGRHGLAVVEDAAQAHGAAVDGRPAGSFGLGSFSFYATKNVTAGEGGVVTTSDTALAERMRMLRNQGMRQRYAYEEVCRNLRLTDLQAAVAVPQLQRLAETTARRARNAAALDEALADVDGLVRPVVPAGRRSAWHQYTVLLPERADRAHVVASMEAAGVVPAVYYPKLVWDYDVYRAHLGVVATPAPEAARVVARCLSVPVHQRLSTDDVRRVADALRAALEA
jgi:dTDP-4-amino-4,6-dideoxygalactose transaminase